MMHDKITLIDTSSWIEALRERGKPTVRERVRELIVDGQAVWCDLVLLELWNGARGEYEKKKLNELQKEIHSLPTTDNVWELSRELARKCRKAGKTVPPSDLLIAACAFHHDAAIEHSDPHFDVIQEIHSKQT
jgi:predicted nucleic acid-binding protein